MYKFNNDVIWRISDPMLHDFLAMGVVGSSARGMCWLAGGALRGLVDKQSQLLDIDLFFSTAVRAAEVALDLEARGFEVVFKCPKGELTTYLGPQANIDFDTMIISDGRRMKIQLITKFFYQNAEIMLDSFDIDACRFAYDGTNLYTDRKALSSAKNRKVTLHKVTYPNATFKRILKYQTKGYKITNEAIDSFTKSVHNMGTRFVELNDEFYVD